MTRSSDVDTAVTELATSMTDRATCERELLTTSDCDDCVLLSVPIELVSTEIDAVLVVMIPATDALTFVRVLLIPATELLTPPSVLLTLPRLD